MLRGRCEEECPRSRLGEELYSWVEALLNAVVCLIEVDRVSSNTTLSEPMKAVIGGKEDAVETSSLGHRDEIMDCTGFGGREM